MPSSRSTGRSGIRAPNPRGPDLSYDRYLVSDLLARPGSVDDVDVNVPLAMEFEQASIEAEATGSLRLEAISGGLLVRGDVRVPATLRCQRCLVEFDADITATITQLYGNADDEEALPVSGDGRVDLAAPVRDELGMAVPLTPICRKDCKGLCATCGTDLNVQPCDGHEESSSSPFASLEGLFDPE